MSAILDSGDGCHTFGKQLWTGEQPTYHIVIKIRAVCRGKFLLVLNVHTSIIIFVSKFCLPQIHFIFLDTISVSLLFLWFHIIAKICRSSKCSCRVSHIKNKTGNRKRNQMTALRFQAGGWHQTSPASLQDTWFHRTSSLSHSVVLAALSSPLLVLIHVSKFHFAWHLWHLLSFCSHLVPPPPPLHSPPQTST